jgi:hypothetical protein
LRERGHGRLDIIVPIADDVAVGVVDEEDVIDIVTLSDLET